MIPKKIHYCWYGNAQKSDLVKKCLETWQKNFPDYEIIEWNESNSDIENSCDFVKQAYKEKKWAYVSDYFRLKALVEYGGIYLDTDVEVIKPFDDLSDRYDFFCCFESEGFLCTAVIGCCKGCGIISHFLETYQTRVFAEIPNSKLFYELLLDSNKFNINEELKLEDNSVILPVEYFSPKDFYTKHINITDNTYAIHHFDGTWKNKKRKLKDSIQNCLIKLLGKQRYFSIKNKYGNKNKSEASK